jgi:hypothetical protein
MEYCILELIVDTNYFTYKMYTKILSHSIDHGLHRADTHGENIISDSLHLIYEMYISQNNFN